MWRHLLYLVCIVEAAALAAILVALVIDPRLAGAPLTPRTRQLCDLLALVLMFGSGYAAARWLYDATVAVREWVAVRRASASRRSEPGAVDLAPHQVEQAPRADRDGRAA